MTRWEYSVVVADPEGAGNDFGWKQGSAVLKTMQILAEAGRNGWELVAVHPANDKGDAQCD